jgi:predicted phosphodiesterase
MRPSPEFEPEHRSERVAQGAEEQDGAERHACLRQVALNEVGRVRREPRADDETDREPREPRDLQDGSPSIATPGRQSEEQQEDDVQDGHWPISSQATADPRPSAWVVATYTADVVTIVHISDPHVGSPHFVPNMLHRVIEEINELGPDAVICSGDLTTDGFRQEYQAWLSYAERIQAPLHTIPGNHDSRNVGYLHFEELIGARNWSVEEEGIRIVGVDSSEPDLNEGMVGRSHYTWILEQFAEPADLKVFVLHHHLIPIPGTGRERSTVMDAGDLLEVLVHAGVHVVLAGHKHVPYVWRLENMYLASAGTCSSLRVRGHTKPCYNVLEFEGGEVTIFRKFPFGERQQMAKVAIATGTQMQREGEGFIQESATVSGQVSAQVPGRVSGAD